MSLQSDYYNSLIHHGIKGQKWGTRRFETADGHLTPAGKERYDVYNEGGKVSKKQKKENLKAAKEEYKNAKKAAKDNYRKATEDADAQYERDMGKESKALDKVKKKYDDLDAATEKQYNSEIEKHRLEAEKAKEDMDFWGESDGFLYQDAKAKYLDSNAKIKDLETRRDDIIAANKVQRDIEGVKVRELYSGNSENAASRQAASRVKAGEDYIKSIMSAKKAYKEAKKQANSRGRS